MTADLPTTPNEALWEGGYQAEPAENYMNLAERPNVGHEAVLQQPRSPNRTACPIWAQRLCYERWRPDDLAEFASVGNLGALPLTEVCARGLPFAESSRMGRSIRNSGPPAARVAESETVSDLEALPLTQTYGKQLPPGCPLLPRSRLKPASTTDRQPFEPAPSRLQGCEFCSETSGDNRTPQSTETGTLGFGQRRIGRRRRIGAPVPGRPATRYSAAPYGSFPG